MPLVYADWITRKMVRAAPDTLFVFGDNLARCGRGGQAAELRGEPNAVGIPTKHRPDMEPGAFLADHDAPAFIAGATGPFARLRMHLEEGGTVVWPAMDIGTGLAQLRTRAPRVWTILQRAKARLEGIVAK